MNTEQAIAILGEFIREARKGVNDMGYHEFYGEENVFEALEYSFDTLCEKQERENPKPLTLEELKKRVGKPVFLVHKAGGRHWDVLTKVTETTEYGKTEIRLFWRGMSELGSGYYPECTQYYDHEPKEAQNEH